MKKLFLQIMAQKKIAQYVAILRRTLRKSCILYKRSSRSEILRLLGRENL